MDSNMFTEEQLEILRKGFQEHDFTQAVPLNLSYEDMTPKQAAAFVALKTRIMDYAKANLPTLDIKRKIGNFSGDFPRESAIGGRFDLHCQRSREHP